MIKENQRLLNILHIIVDAIIIYLSFNLAYILRLDEFNSPLIRWHIISPPLGYYKDMSQYQNLLTMIVPCYLIIYGFCGMYDPKRTSGRRAELFAFTSQTFLVSYTVLQHFTFSSSGITQDFCSVSLPA